VASVCSPAVRWRHVVVDDDEEEEEDEEEEVCSYGLGYGLCLNVTLGRAAESDLLHTSN